MSINIMFWNYKGPGNLYFYEILRDLSRANRADLIFIAEPRVSGDKAEEIIRRINMQFIQKVKAISRSGRLWMLSRNNNYKIEVIELGSHYIHLSISGYGVPAMVCMIVYIHPHDSMKQRYFENIKMLTRNTTSPWVIIGDFNEILSELEKMGGAPIDQR